MAQQMKMIESLSASNKSTNDQMEKQMDLITNLQQTVAELLIKIGDCNLDTSTNTSTEQRKWSKISHNLYMMPVQCQVHSSNAGTATATNSPPDTDQDPPTDTAATNGMDKTKDTQEDENLQTMQEAANGGSQDGDDILEQMICTSTDRPQSTQEYETWLAPDGQQETKC